MRVQCDVCEKALAEVVCCADEAALCASCDQRVHDANKLASKHQRLRLLPNHPSSLSPLPLCDICQEKGAFIFCLEDRALVCRNCDVCIHAVNTLAAKHQRFLATGIRVALESKEQHASDESTQRKPEAPPPSGTSVAFMPTSNSSSHITPMENPTQDRVDADEFQVIKSSVKDPQEWQNAQNLGFSDLDSTYPLGEIEFSKALLSDQDWMMDLSVFDDHVYADSCAEVPQTSFSTCSPTSHGSEVIVKGKHRRDVSGFEAGLVPDFDDDDVSVVPDLLSLAFQVPHPKRQKCQSGN